MSKSSQLKRKKKRQAFKKKRNSGNNGDISYFHLGVTFGSMMYIAGLFVPFCAVSPENHPTYIRVLFFGYGYLFLMSFNLLASIYGFIKKKKYWKTYVALILASLLEPVALSSNLLFYVRFGLGYFLLILGVSISLFSAAGIGYVEKYSRIIYQE